MQPSPSRGVLGVPNFHARVSSCAHARGSDACVAGVRRWLQRELADLQVAVSSSGAHAASFDAVPLPSASVSSSVGAGGGSGDVTYDRAHGAAATASTARSVPSPGRSDHRPAAPRSRDGSRDGGSVDRPGRDGRDALVSHASHSTGADLAKELSRRDAAQDPDAAESEEPHQAAGLARYSDESVLQVRVRVRVWCGAGHTS